MPERVAGVGAWNGNHGQPLGLAVSDDDLRVVRVSVPLERDRVAGVLACVEFDEHPSRLRLLVRGRARGMPWVLLRGSAPDVAPSAGPQDAMLVPWQSHVSQTTGWRPRSFAGDDGPTIRSESAGTTHHRPHEEDHM